ncbi:MAG: 23S rRNA (uracil(1939)-C(5))-methyltransferase RlmD [Clostridia bacterium]|nr:23S rRNA (uracil(1939)-C(5))-methyltransferase RlmD [Clostridia bacterium]
MKKNDVFELTITARANSGDGIGRHDGIAVFVPGAAVGDVCEIVVIKMLSNRAIGKITKIIKASQDRIENDCPAFPACGGCQYRHLDYTAELQSKERSVYDAVLRIGGIEPPRDLEILGAENTTCYRNKAMYPVVPTVSGAEYGFYRSGTHNVIPCKRNGEHVPCAIQAPEFETAASVVVKWMNDNAIPAYSETEGKGAVRMIYLRKAETTGQLMVCLVSAKKNLPAAEDLVSRLKAAAIGFHTLILNYNPDKTNAVLGKTCKTLYGEGTITDTLCGVKLSISPLSFYQVNRTQCEKLYGTAIKFAENVVNLKTTDLLDLYCGVGSIGLAFAKHCRSVFGIEIIPDAIENARKNAELNGITNAEFRCGDASTAPEVLRNANFKPNLVTVDPPRKGMSADVVEFLKDCGAKYVVYISCEPTTLARDAALLSDTFEMTNLKAVDMFPRTANTEAVACFKRKA